MEALKGLVLAGTRPEGELAALAGGRPHHLVPVANRALIDYSLEALRACGVRELAVAVTPHTAPAIAAALDSVRAPGMSVELLELDSSPTLPEALAAAADFLDGAAALVHPGDGLVLEDFAPHVEEFGDGGWDALLLVRNGTELERRVPGLLEPRGLRLVTDRAVAPPDQALAGVFAFGPSAVELAGSLVTGGATADVHGFLDAIAAGDGRMEARLVCGSWKYAGGVDGMLEVNRLVLDQMAGDLGRADLDDARIEGRVVLADDVVLDRATVRGPAIIGPGAVLQDTFVGPYSSIGAGVRMEGAEIEHSIVLPGATLRHLGTRIQDSLVGQDAIVARDFSLPSALRLRVGEQAEVSLA